MGKRILPLVLLFIVSCSDENVVEQPHSNRYNTDNSILPSNQIQAITIANHVKWIGTPEGVSKIDGTHWSTYTTLNSSLPSDFITSIAVDKAGNVWVGT